MPKKRHKKYSQKNTLNPSFYISSSSTQSGTDCFLINFLIVIGEVGRLSCSCIVSAFSGLCRRSLFWRVPCSLWSTWGSFFGGDPVFGVGLRGLGGCGVDGFGLVFCCIRLHDEGRVCHKTAFCPVESAYPATHTLDSYPYHDFC